MPAEGRTKSPSNTKKEETKEKKDVKADDAKKASGFSPKTAIIIAGVAAAAYGAKMYLGDKVNMQEVMENAVKFVESKGQTAVLWYCLFTFVGVVCLIPTTPMEFAGGFLFSPSYGMWTVLAFTGASKLMANMVSVLIARFVVRDWVIKNVVSKFELLQMVTDAVKDEPWKMAFLVRGSMVPLFVKNYGLGVTEIAYIPNACCSMIFTNFYAFQNIYFGSTMQDLKDVFAPKKAAAGGDQDWTATIKKCAPIAFNVLLILLLVRAVKQQIKKQKSKIEEELKTKNDKKETKKDS